MTRSGTAAKRRRRAPATRRREPVAKATATAAAPLPAGSTAAEPAAAGGSHRLDGPLLIRDVSVRAAELRQALDAGVRSFDLSGVSVIDTAGVQLLLALVHEAARRQQALSLRGCRPVVMEATRTLGLATKLALTTEAA